MLAQTQETVTIDNGIPIPEGFNMAEVERILRNSRFTVYELVKKGELTKVNIGKRAIFYGVREYVNRKLAEARQNVAA